MSKSQQAANAQAAAAAEAEAKAKAEAEAKAKAEAEAKAKAEAEAAAPKTVAMTRDPDVYPEPHTADVHPEEVASYEAGGWEVAP